MMEIGA